MESDARSTQKTTKIVDSVLFVACLSAALWLTQRSMKANLAQLTAFVKNADGTAEKYGAQPGARYVRIDGTFWNEFAWPLVIQGAITTCYCVLLFVAVSFAVSALAYANVMLKAAALFKVAPGKKGDVLHAALRAVLHNSLASAEMMIIVTLSMAVVTLFIGAVVALMIVAGRSKKWSFVDSKVRYVDVDYVTKMSEISTSSGLVSAVGFMFWGTKVRRTAQHRTAAFVAAVISSVDGFFKSLAMYFEGA